MSVLCKKLHICHLNRPTSRQKFSGVPLPLETSATTGPWGAVARTVPALSTKSSCLCIRESDHIIGASRSWCRRRFNQVWTWASLLHAALLSSHRSHFILPPGRRTVPSTYIEQLCIRFSFVISSSTRSSVATSHSRHLPTSPFPVLQPRYPCAPGCYKNRAFFVSRSYKKQ